MRQRKTSYLSAMLSIASLYGSMVGDIDLPNVKTEPKEITEEDVNRELEAIRQKKAKKRDGKKKRRKR